MIAPLIDMNYLYGKEGGERMNQVGLVGRITKDPELRYYNEKRPYAVFTLAINRSYKNNQGNVEADFIQCCAWGRLAETVAKHCGKGSMIGINGRLNTRSFVNQNNSKMYTMDVVAEDVRFYQLKTPTLVDLNDFEHPEQSSAAESTSQASSSDAIHSSSSSKDSTSNESIVAETIETLNISKAKVKLPIPS